MVSDQTCIFLYDPVKMKAKLIISFLIVFVIVMMMMIVVVVVI